VLAKSIDIINTQLGHQALFPFIIQPTVNVDTHIIDFPIGMIWDIHVSMPIKWQNIRLAKAERLNGTNGDTATEFTGTLRLMFSGNTNNGPETLLFYADYNINSALDFQRVAVGALTDTIAHVSNVISHTEASTIGGYIIFKTQNLYDPNSQTFFADLSPPGTSSTYAVYEVTNSISGGANVTEDFSLDSLVHGTGLLTDSAYNAIPPLNTDVQTWISAFNYPFDSEANLRSVENDINGTYFQIPIGLFKEFNIVAPASDTEDTSAYRVYLSKAQSIATGHIRFFFACRSANADIVEDFASMDLYSSGQPNDIIKIIPLTTDNATADTERQMGVGYAILSTLWDGSTTSISDYFYVMQNIVFSDKIANYTDTSTRISAFGVSRISKYSPSYGESQALKGSSSNRAIPVLPSASNKFVTEKDRGLGDRVDLEARFAPTSAIERYGYAGGNSHKIVKLVVDSTLVPNDANFYDNAVKPRLVALFGRDPEFGDGWYNGVRFLTWNGDSWVG
jgi:hypothetical protein